MTDLADFRVEFPGPADEIAMVVASGELDLHSSPPFKDALVGAIEGGASRVVVDLTGVTFIDSSALGALIGGARRSALNRTELMIVCPPGSVARVIELTGLHRAFTIYPTREEALGAPAGAVDSWPSAHETPASRQCSLPEPVTTTTKRSSMECPACHRELTTMTVGGVKLDVCKGGCAGIWFNAFELKKFAEPNEFAGDELLEMKPAPGVVVDQTARYKCPECADHPVMMRHFASAKRGVTVDECPECGGDWLDPGELRNIRDEFPTEEARTQAAQAYFDEVFGGQLTAEKARSDEQLAKAHKFANHFRFICPSYYIPGEQQWGAF